MARAGILYSHVATAATKLADAGKNPTVDSVREALGSTGSKSTIAPMLKRWKTDHQDQGIAQDAGLPPGLLQAVKGLHEQMQHDADVKIEAAYTVAEAEKQALAEQFKAAQQQVAHLAHERDELNGLLSKERAERTQLDKAHHQLQLAYTKLEADVIGQLQRLADRQTEVDGLHRQLDQARTQFEHYQQATAAQRTEERQQAEQSRHHLEVELAAARQIAGEQKTVIAQGQQELRHMHHEKDRLSSELALLQAVHAALQSERGVQEQQIKAVSALHAEARSQVDTMSGALAQAKNNVETLSAEKPQLQERIVTLETKVQSLLDENKNLAIDKARLEGLHSQAAAHIAGAN